MNRQAKAFLEEFVNTPSPSGFEAPAQKIWKRYVEPFVDEVKSDIYGNTVAVLNAGGSPRVMLAGHCDEVGFMVSYINKEGFIYFRPIGGIDPMILPAMRVNIHTDKGVVKGAVGRRAIHMQQKDDKDKLRIKDHWIDIGAKNRKDAGKYVSVGDTITFDSHYQELQNGFVMARGLDDKMGGVVVAEALRLLSRRKLKAAVYGVSTVQEECGIWGARLQAFNLEPDVAVATDVTNGTDTPGISKERFGDVQLGKGPEIAIGSAINPLVERRLRQVARKWKIPFQRCAAASHTGTDADVIAPSRTGVATGLISVPNRYMHTPAEIIHLDDLDNAAKLMAEFVLSLDAKTSFHPDI
ncbi:MAG: M42 family metallopeptidase [Candidatus Eisenbacteria sp.]|nr:M42 family metallopeptidase [Candidatus Eisenbacteria bacterium]